MSGRPASPACPTDARSAPPGASKRRPSPQRGRRCGCWSSGAPRSDRNHRTSSERGAVMKLHSNARTCPHGRALIVSRVTDGGQKPTAVALEFRVTERTVRKWLKRFRAEGATGLTDRSCRPGRIPRRYLQPGEELHHAVFALLHTPPSDHGFNRTSWKLSDLANVLRAQGKTSTQRNIGA